jgi:hypothetical protein
MELNINNYQEYFTHSNGSRPYKIIIYNNNLVRVFKSDNCILNVFPQQIFVGKSEKNKMTEYSGGYGASFDGNTILLKMNDTTYFYIGGKMFSFTVNNPIISYYSPVGNNDVPYPYAIDSKNNYYLMIEDVILNNTKELINFLINNNDPYEYYYQATLITEDRGIGTKPLFQNNSNIIRFYIGKELYTMKYSPLPSNEFDRFTKELGNNVYIRDKNNVKHNISKQQYIEIMEEFGNLIGVSPMIITPFDI